MRCMGLDVGDVRIGVAISDALGMLARPLMVLERKDEESDIAAIVALATQHGVERIVAGLPRSMDGTIGFQAEKAQAFIQKLKSKAGVKIELRDERLSTVSAKRFLREGGKKKQSGQKVLLDAAAAAIILQTYLDETQSLPVPPEG
jgi:putative Holliday junction resolvase